MDNLDDMMPILKDIEALRKKYNTDYFTLMTSAKMLILFEQCLPGVTDPKVRAQREKEWNAIKEAK